MEDAQAFKENLLKMVNDQATNLQEFFNHLWYGINNPKAFQGIVAIVAARDMVNDQATNVQEFFNHLWYGINNPKAFQSIVATVAASDAAIFIAIFISKFNQVHNPWYWV